MNNPTPFSAHKDVLEAPIPGEDEAKARLLDELKNRGRMSVQAQHWPDAASLYQKALECAVSDSDRAILNANLALVEGKMNGWDQSREAAQKAVAADPAYTKGWWRLGQAEAALKHYKEAVDALKEAIKLEPTNKALKKELEKQEELLKEAYSASKEEAKTEKATTTVEKTGASASKPATGSKEASSTKAEKMEIDDVEFSKSEPVKGYKIVNGKKTSYFHNELSEDAKKLIGSIAPKKLDAAPAPTEAPKEGTSAWNKAGTWEERDVTAWALESLKAKLLETTYTLPESSPAPGAVVTTTKARVDGHASVATVRGKKRYIYELSVTVDWKFEHEEVDANGSLVFPDIDGTCALGEGYDATDFHVSHADTQSVRPLLDAFVHKQGWREAIHKCIDDWVQLYQDTY